MVYIFNNAENGEIVEIECDSELEALRRFMSMIGYNMEVE
jgi:hypothetical protein